LSRVRNAVLRQTGFIDFWRRKLLLLHVPWMMMMAPTLCSNFCRLDPCDIHHHI
jgi:hypothetical protein